MRLLNLEARGAKAEDIMMLPCAQYGVKEVLGSMAMLLYELFALIEQRTTAWAHRGHQNH